MGVTLSYSGLGGKLKFSGTSGRFRTVYTKPLLLSLYPGAAGAYSLRKLSSTYTGSAIRVRRSSDNTETNIGFNSTDGLDTTSLTSFVGAGSGFVTTWYDQSGNSRNLVQTTNANQPIIVNTGTVQIINGKPIVYFDTTAKSLSVAYGFPGANSFIFDVLQSNSTRFLVYHGASGGSTYVSVGNNADSNPNINGGATVSQYYRNGALQTSPTTRIGIYNLVSTNTQILLTHKLELTSWPAFIISGYSAYEFVHYKSEIIIYNTDQTANRPAIESNINSYYSIYTPTWQGTGTALLDLYPSSAGAYSLRNLSSTYTGPLVRVRRSSDNAEQDIYGTLAGQLDTTSLLSFVGAGNGFVTTWYDQSGNSRNSVQATTANQPIIVSSGTIQLLNNKPAIYFDTVNSNLATSYGFPGATSFIFDVLKTSDTRFNLYHSANGGLTIISVAISGDTSTSINYNATVFNYYKNGVVQTSPTNRNEVYLLIATGLPILLTHKCTMTGWTAFNLSGYTSSTSEHIHYRNEIIIYNTDQTSNRTAIESNINSNYTIY